MVLHHRPLSTNGLLFFRKIVFRNKSNPDIIPIFFCAGRKKKISRKLTHGWWEKFGSWNGGKSAKNGRKSIYFFE